MAKRRPQPQAGRGSFEPTTRRRNPVRMSLPAEVEARLTSLRQKQGASHHKQSVPAGLRTEALKRPGALEEIFERIKIMFEQNDLLHRAVIDQQVMECFRVARFLRANWRNTKNLFAGEWIKYWAANGRNGDAALRFVFKKVHADAKKASFYFRATRKLFEEGVRPADIPSRVTTAGGYQELADQNAKRPPAAKLPSQNSGANDGIKFPADAELKAPPRQRVTRKQASSPNSNSASSPEHSDAGVDRPSHLVIITEAEGVELFGLNLPCLVHLDVELSLGADGKLAMEVLGVAQAD